jgi:hypothetical protein
MNDNDLLTAVREGLRDPVRRPEGIVARPRLFRDSPRGHPVRIEARYLGKYRDGDHVRQLLAGVAATRFASARKV